MMVRQGTVRRVALATAILASGWTVQAQVPGSEGIVRISDGPRTPVQQAGHHHAMKKSYQEGKTFADCPECQGFVGGDCHSCKGHGCWGKCCLGGKFQEHYCTNSADFGYSVPSKYPIQRRGVQYTSYFPSQWYGADGAAGPPAYPMVYTPTDTTQLGFYYQHVPFWQPYPNPLPAKPHPAQWHNYAQSVYASEFHYGSAPHYGGYGQHHGLFHHGWRGQRGWNQGGMMMGADCPVPNGVEVAPQAIPPQPEQAPAALDPTPAAPQPLPDATSPTPAPPQESAADPGTIRTVYE